MSRFPQAVVVSEIALVPQMAEHAMADTSLRKTAAQPGEIPRMAQQLLANKTSPLLVSQPAVGGSAVGSAAVTSRPAIRTPLEAVRSDAVWGEVASATVAPQIVASRRESIL